ncbi:hypothetical protein LY76DRAFT_300972 [Colletotrichum caudatum]|nr:hypothetical protein LY76DRAFT_300972 [Colletotrichum caudatum]
MSASTQRLGSALGGAHESNAPRRNDRNDRDDAYTETSSDAGAYPDPPLLDPSAPEIDVKAELSRDPIPEEARSSWSSAVRDLDAAVASRAGALGLFLDLEKRMSRVLTSFGVRALLSPQLWATLAFEQSPDFVTLGPDLRAACETWNIPPCVLIFCHLDQVPRKQARLIRNALNTGTPFPTFLRLLLLSVRSRRAGEGKMPGVNRTSDRVQPYDLNRALDWISATDPKPTTIGKVRRDRPTSCSPDLLVRMVWVTHADCRRPFCVCCSLLTCLLLLLYYRARRLLGLASRTNRQFRGPSLTPNQKRYQNLPQVSFINKKPLLLPRRTSGAPWETTARFA